MPTLMSASPHVARLSPSLLMPHQSSICISFAQQRFSCALIAESFHPSACAAATTAAPTPAYHSHSPIADSITHRLHPWLSSRVPREGLRLPTPPKQLPPSSSALDSTAFPLRRAPTRTLDPTSCPPRWWTLPHCCRLCRDRIGQEYLAYRLSAHLLAILRAISLSHSPQSTCAGRYGGKAAGRFDQCFLSEPIDGRPYCALGIARAFCPTDGSRVR